MRACYAHGQRICRRCAALADLINDAVHLKHERINTIISGYACHRDSPLALPAWIIAAGLQIAAWRHANRARPGVPAAAEALERVLIWQNRLNA